MKVTGTRIWLLNLVIMCAYVLLAYAGFRFSSLIKQVSPVWPPSGFALAALLLWGFRLWPGIALGAFVANYTSGEPIWVAILVAMGNTLEATTGAALLRRFGLQNSLDRVRDVIALLAGSVLVSTTIAATVGAAALTAGGIATANAFKWVWLTWWVGDGMGILVVAPVLLVWFQKQPRLKLRQQIEAAALAAVVLTLTLLTLSLDPSHRSTLLQYFEFPVLIWAALRFKQCGSTLAILLIASVSAWLTIHGSGPFAQSSQLVNLRLLQAFVAALAITGLVLGAISAERARLNQELIAARDTAIEASRAKSLFLANMSHELRTPLTAVIGYSEMLQEEYGEASPIRVESDLRSIKSAATHLLELINDILDLSKIEAGKLEIQPEDVLLTPLLSEVVSTITPLATRNGNTVEVECLLPGNTKLRVDPVRLRQVLFNLLSNAAKFTHDGCIVLRVERLTEGDSLEFIVSDTGIGMNSDQLGKLFQSFQQLDPSSTRRYGGTGLGLAISRYLAEQMRGSLTVQSEEGKGSIFTLRLTYAAAP